MATVKVFVYGTLMHRQITRRWHLAEGQTHTESYLLKGWASEAEVEPPVEGTASGTLYNYGGAYPYADFDGDDTIHGQVLTFDDEHPAYHQMCRVELGAGYSAREIPVTTSTGAIVCTAWQIKPETKRSRMARGDLWVIRSGDWRVQDESDELVVY